MARSALLISILALASPAAAEERECAIGPSEYAAGLCFYLAGALEDAGAIFERIVKADVPSPETLKSRYFLARTRMKQKRWNDASEEWIKIYSLSPAFYEEWSCDFLLGESRRAMGLD